MLGYIAIVLSIAAESMSSQWTDLASFYDGTLLRSIGLLASSVFSTLELDFSIRENGQTAETSIGNTDYEKLS